MAKFVGVDWGSTGWICAIYDGDDSWDAEYHPSFLSIWKYHEDADWILVDIPIGLVEQGVRQCDEAAEEILEERPQSVFYTPPRPLLQSTSYPEAKEEYEELTGRGMTIQAWSFMPRIREVDDFFAKFPEAHGLGDPSTGNLRESHPEVCFSKLAEGKIDSSKLDERGIEQRIDVLEKYCDSVSSEYQLIVDRYIDSLESHERRFSTDHRDDIVDAMVLALTASLSGDKFQTLPEEPPVDQERNVPIEIVYEES